MKALVLPAIKSNVELQDRPTPKVEAHQVLVRVRAAALNRRDYWITQGLYPKIVTPVVLGSDGAGTIETLGSSHPEWKNGDEVVIYPAREWGDDESAQSDSFTVLGMPEDGTFAEYVCVGVDQLFPKPKHLDWAETAAIPVAGITAFRAVMVQGGLQAGQKVLITGIGGGVAVFACQIALAAQATVTVTSSQASKIEKALGMGASAGFNYKKEGWAKDCLKKSGPFDLIIDGAGGPAYADLVSLLKPGGSLVNYGSTAGRPENLDLFKIFWRQLKLVGSSLGSPRDFAQLLSFMEQHQVKPIIDRRQPLCDGAEAIAGMKSAEQFGNIVLEC